MAVSLQSLLNIIAILIAVVGGSWEFLVKPHLRSLGYGRILEPINNKNCKTIPELPACEKIVLHQPSGVLYLACSTPMSRIHWTPAISRLNETGASYDDYVGTYDPRTSRTTRFKIQNFKSNRGLSLHGMDIVPSSSNPSELFVYLVNHRAPLGGILAKNVGADSAIEIFKTTIGGTTLTHVKTVEDPIIITPNDLVGSSDGKSFYFTNDHGAKVGLVRELDLLGFKSTSVGYCHIDNGCHYAIRNMQSSNGIVKAANGTIYVANSLHGGLSVLEQQADNTLVLTDFIPADRSMDNVSIDSKGYVWAAAFPDTISLLLKHFKDPSIPASSSALRFSVNTNPKETPYGIKYKVEKMFEDDGGVASGITSVAYDADRNLLFLDGLASPHLTVCKL